MTESDLRLRLPDSLRRAAERLAREDGVTLDHWVTAAVAQKVGAVETAASYLSRRAGGAKPLDMLPYLESAPRRAPERDDEGL